MVDALDPVNSSRHVVVEEHVQFTLEELCHACLADTGQVIAFVEEGVLEPAGDAPSEWVFRGDSLRRARLAVRMTRDLEVDVSSLALVMDLLDQIDGLRRRLRMMEG